ncbi:MAG: PD-(D/E)XK nuclease family protein, partial [Myxococcota bacterium]|nr:PD-(D/E)XK nuclease family protein [Myxococcota bacterium]
VFECRDPYNEHRNTAMKLCNLIQGGVNPADCCVAVANLERELPVLSQVFADHGLSFDVATGPPLASLPVPALLLAIPQAFQQPDSAVELLKVLQTDLVRAPGGLDLAAIWAVCRCTGIHEGSPKDWLNEWDSKQIPLPQGLENAVLGFQHLFDTLTNRFNEQHSPGSFEEAILETAERLGLPNTCHAEGGSNRADQHAHLGWIRATERLGTWRNELLATDRSSWGFDELLTSLTRCFQASRVATEPRRDEAVKVVGILELRGLTPRHLFLSNLIRASFPTPRALNPFLSHETGRRLEAIDPMSEARYLLMSALRNSLGDGDIQTLTLSWPAVSRGRETVPASALQDLLSTQTQCPKGSTLGRFILQRPGHATPTPICQTDILTRLAAAGNFSDAPWLNLPLINRQRECMHNRGKDTFSNYDGHLVSAPPLPSSIGPTGVESYVRCSARHWYSRVLRLSGLPTYEPQVPPGVRGTAMHLILERYEKQGPDPANPAAELHAIALEVFSELEVGYVGNPILLHIERDRMAAGLVDDAPGGPLKAWLELETTHQDWRTPEASELSFEDIQVGPVRLRGSIDRVDRLNSPNGHLVIDFKTGSVPSADLVRKGLAFQPIAYLEATARIWPDEPGVAAYMSVGKAGAVSFNTWVGDPSLIGSLVPKRRQRSAVPLDSQQRKALLDYAADSMKRMHRGVFHTTLSSPDEAGCTSCDFRRICRVDRHRNQRIAESGGDLQLPFEMEEA